MLKEYKKLTKEIRKLDIKLFESSPEVMQRSILDSQRKKLALTVELTTMAKELGLLKK